MCLSDFPNMVTTTEIESSSRERIGKHDFYEFVVRLDFPGSAADVPGLELLSPHIHRKAGEKNTCISHMSEAAAASLVTLPAIYTP